MTLLLKGDGVWSRMKHEGGPHRVQRVPVTESQGRIHTSSATVTVLPEAEEVEVEIDPNDLRIDVYRSSGPGGQGVNTADSAVRITHLPTGLVVQCQNERSQLRNRDTALRILRSRLYEQAEKKRREELAELTGAKKEIAFGNQIRSYTFHPEQRIKDHRTNVEVGNVEAMMDGDIDAFVKAYLLWSRGRET